MFETRWYNKLELFRSEVIAQLMHNLSENVFRSACKCLAHIFTHSLAPVMNFWNDSSHSMLVRDSKNPGLYTYHWYKLTGDPTVLAELLWNSQEFSKIPENPRVYNYGVSICVLNSTRFVLHANLDISESCYLAATWYTFDGGNFELISYKLRRMSVWSDYDAVPKILNKSELKDLRETGKMSVFSWYTWYRG